jgi:hypothetical protein
MRDCDIDARKQQKRNRNNSHPKSNLASTMKNLGNLQKMEYMSRWEAEAESIGQIATKKEILLRTGTLNS